MASQHERQRQRERRPAGDRVRDPRDAERDGNGDGERDAGGIDVGQRQRADERCGNPEEGEHRGLLPPPRPESKVGYRRLQSSQQERREPLQQRLVVAGLRRRELGDEAQRVGASERVGQRAHDEMQAPRELLLRQLRKRPSERGLEALDHRRVLLGQEASDERRGIGVRASEEAEKILAAPFGVAREPQRRHEHRRQDAIAGQCRFPGFALECRQQVEALLVHRIEPPRQHGLEQHFLAAEVVVDRREVDAGGRRDRTEARGFEPVLHEQRLGGVQDPVLGHRGTARESDRKYAACHRVHSSIRQAARPSALQCPRVRPTYPEPI